MSNLRSDCRNLIKDLEPGNTWRVHILALCEQIDLLEESWHEANRRIVEAQEILKTVSCPHWPTEDE